VLRDLAVPPNNRLETLRGDRAGRHSIRERKEPESISGRESFWTPQQSFHDQNHRLRYPA
jgi:hypothetical protein